MAVISNRHAASADLGERHLCRRIVQFVLQPFGGATLQQAGNPPVLLECRGDPSEQTGLISFDREGRIMRLKKIGNEFGTVPQREIGSSEVVAATGCAASPSRVIPCRLAQAAQAGAA
ncbi:MAG TPA: hypothetical protein VGC10_01050 [Sphingomonas sp.]